MRFVLALDAVRADDLQGLVDLVDVQEEDAVCLLLQHGFLGRDFHSREVHNQAQPGVLKRCLAQHLIEEEILLICLGETLEVPEDGMLDFTIEAPLHQLLQKVHVDRLIPLSAILLARVDVAQIPQPVHLEHVAQMVLLRLDVTTQPTNQILEE